MRHLIVMRGAPGAGKSTFIDRQGLRAYVVSPDDFRIRLGGVVMAPDGTLAVSHANERRVWAEVEEVLDFKMNQGQLVILDATFQRSRDFAMPRKLANAHRYQISCVDFANVPKAVALKQNHMREEWKTVPDAVIETAYERLHKNPVPKDVHAIDAGALEDGALLERLEPECRDLSGYRSVMHVGDLQGCFAPVEALFSEGFRDDTYYIFIGDLLDRGIQNGEVIKFAVDEILPRDNVALIWGNHEYHIHRFARDLEPVSKDFRFNTLPQLEAAKFTRAQANALLDKAEDAFTYEFHGKKVLVTHAGLSKVPERLVTLPSLQFWKGTGNYNDPVDATFSAAMAGTGWLQVHGHRNSRELPVEAAPGSYNLEGQVEFGGHLRVMTLTADAGQVEAATREIKNEVYNKSAPRHGVEAAETDEQKGIGSISEATLAALERHPLVKEKRFASHPHIRSMNFTRKAFFDGRWDQVNIMARGLFVADDRRIVARSYPKFFNLEERAETQFRNLRNRLQFPLKLWVKENGFLGILGWDHVSAELLFASKSTPESEFAMWFREIFESEAGDTGLRRAVDIVGKRNLSLVFEVNDPVRDPHMITYERPHVVLLDAIRREEKFSHVSHEELKQIGSAIGGIAVKQSGPTLKSWEEFEGWFKAVETAGREYRWRGQHVEGFVAEDVSGFQFKIKLDFYSFWKWMRGHRDKIRRAREKQRPLPMPPDDPLAEKFHNWLIFQPDEALEQDIIQLRAAFERDAANT